MTSPQQRKGDHFEREVTKYLQAAGIRSIVRRHDGGTRDAGDLVLGPFGIEVKAYLDVTRGLREGIEEATRAAATTGLLPVAIVKRHGFPVSAAYFVLQLRDVPELATMLRVQ